ncbi:hypothetical protein GGTG_12334 [Gaeumannomyces tritici R3-111a-1]|uniref:Uncharacterized protein n=1 Tax=Gaeumannomyces tritici (strain R3-111a-1) TaxID=644352 RepID=J3PFQ9_GAET3|nr:hypothetical protein GGTG_12334 [Gaeumannomyces tritici R3-111a-1]EJT70161.1 hypothetical protein GGTG_12334 [Gaeumannomyces tritici R3-111a-1]
MRHCHHHSHPPHLPPGLAARGGHGWPGASQDQHRRPRRRWAPPDPGSLLAQIAAHTAEPLWKTPQNWTQAHVDFFCCRFEGAAEGPPQGGGVRAQSSQAVSSPRPKSRRASSIMSLLSNKERSVTPTDQTLAADPDKSLTAIDERPPAPPGWTAFGLFRLVLGWSLPAGGAACPALSRLLLRDDDDGQRAGIKKMLDRGTGLEFHCKRQALFLLVDGAPCATLELNLCVPSQRRPPVRSWQSLDGLIRTFFRRRRSSSSISSDKMAQKGDDKAGEKLAEDSRTTSGATTPTTPPTPPLTPPPQPQPQPQPQSPRVFPAAALVGEHSQAATLLRGLALGHVELGGVDQARANGPVAATMRKCLRGVTPAVRLHDPYLLAVVIAMAQGQEAWRARLRADDEEVLRRNGEEWLCEGGYKVRWLLSLGFASLTFRHAC